MTARWSLAVVGVLAALAAFGATAAHAGEKQVALLELLGYDGMDPHAVDGDVARLRGPDGPVEGAEFVIARHARANVEAGFNGWKAVRLGAGYRF